MLWVGWLGAVGAAEVANVYSGTASSWGNGTVTVAIPAVDTTKSFLMFHTRHASNRPVGSMLRGRIASSTSVEFVRVTNETSTVNIQWYVVEYSAGVVVQRGVLNQTNATFDVSLPTPVASKAQAFVLWSKTPRSTDQTWSDDDPLAARLLDTSTLRFRATSANPAHVIWWQVVEYTNPADINVQEGVTSLTGNARNRNVTLPSPVNLGSSFALVGFRAQGSSPAVGRRMLTAWLRNANTLRIRRLLGGENIPEIYWQVVELKDGSTVQSGRQRLNAGITQRTRSITPIDPSRSVAFASVQPVGGQNMAASNYAADDVIGVGSFTLGLTATQLILRRDTSPARAVVSWFVVELNGAPAPPPAALAYYAMDESAWTGAAGEVVDDSGNANHGTALGGAQTVDPGKVCRGGDIPANSTNSPPDAVDSGVDIDDDVGSQGTVSFWYRSDAAWSGGGGRTLADASTTTDNKYFYLVLRNNGRLRFGLEDSADRDFRLNTAVNSFAAGTWVHVAVTWNLPGDRLEIYIDGVLAASNTRNTSGALGELGTLYLGDNRSTYHPGGSANSADGVLDEVRIYDQALTASEIQTDMNATHPCPALDHFAVIHDGAGVNCQAEPTTIEAHLADHSIDTTYAGTIALSTSTAHGDWSLLIGSGVLANGGSGAATYAFDPVDAGRVVLGYENTFAETVNINVLDGPTTESAGEDPNLVFAASGFNFLADSVADAIGVQIAAKDSDQPPGAQALELEAIDTNTSTGACEAALTGIVVVELAFECVDPASCAGQQVTLTGTPIAGNPSGSVSSYTPVNLDFGGATDATAPFAMGYPDAGRIRLHARLELLDAGGAGTGNYMIGASNSFVVRPFGFDLDFSDDRATNGTTGPSYAADAAGSVFVKAGENFVTTVTAVVWDAAEDVDDDGVPDSGADLSDNPATPNYGQEIAPTTVAVTHSLVLPPAAGGADPGVLSGGGALGGFVAGVATATLSWDEVGISDLAALDSNYLGSGAAVGGAVRNVGRFYPARLQVQANAPLLRDGPDLAWGCAFTYIEQPFGYLVDPVYTVRAQNLGGSLTDNYGGNFWKLSALLDNRFYTDEAVTAGATLLPPVQVGGVTLAGEADYDGTGTLTLSGETLAYQRALAPEAPFAGQVALTIPALDLRDTDGVCYSAAPSCNVNDGDAGIDDTVSGIAGSNLRFGRLVLGNAAGSELLDLAVALQAAYFDGSGFTVNTADACTVLGLGSIDLVNQHEDPATGVDTITVTLPSATTTASLTGLSAGVGDLELSAPGAGNTGYTDLRFDLSTAWAGLPWLRYDWDGDAAHDDDPWGRATFGVYQGADVLIHMREPWN